MEQGPAHTEKGPPPRVLEPTLTALNLCFILPPFLILMMTLVTEQLDSDFSMLKRARGFHTGLAWLSSEEVQKALKVRGLSSGPVNGGLSFYAPDFALSNAEPWLIGTETPYAKLEPRGLPRLEHRLEPSGAEFERHLEDILQHISRGTFEKVVPIVCEDLEFAAPLEASMFQPSEERPGTFTYGFEYQSEGMSGQTPELLFEVRDGVLRTMALAGTGKSGGPSLLEDMKERHEHQIVIDHICSELKAYGEPVVAATVERDYGKLKHLLTPIEMQMKEPISYMNLVRTLHPTAALGGWPRQPAVAWLEEQPFHFSRKRFGAPFGFQDGDHMVCVVAIRGVQWSGMRARVSAGCGVVAESVAMREWNELRMKRESIYRSLGMEL